MAKTRKQKEGPKVTRDPQVMMPFVQIPKEPVRKIKTTGVKTLVLKPKMTTEEISKRQGSQFDEKDVDEIFDEDVDVQTTDEKGENKRLLARFRKNVLDHKLLEQAWAALQKTAAPSRNRGAAAGPIELKSAQWQKRKPVEVQGWSARYLQNGKTSKMRVNNNVFSSVLGYFDATPFMGLPCRLTSYTQKYFQQFQKGIPFIQALDHCFKTLTPEAHAAQLARAKKQPAYQIDGTAYSSVTVNRNFRTALHMDDGDFREGFGNLSVLEYGKQTGGQTLFPQYKVGFNIRTGDYLAMDVHQWHCNTAMHETAEQKEQNKKLPAIYENDLSTGTLGQDKPQTRISFVCQLREKLLKCDTKETKKQQDKIGFDPKKGAKPSHFTRKKKRERTGEASDHE